VHPHARQRRCIWKGPEVVGIEALLAVIANAAPRSNLLPEMFGGQICGLDPMQDPYMEQNLAGRGANLCYHGC
jgi:hypothetical protein